MTQDSFKQLPLHWDGVCVRCCAFPFRAESQFPLSICSPKYKSFWFLKPDILWAYLPNAGLLDWRAHVAIKTIFWEEVFNLTFLLFVNHQPSLWVLTLLSLFLLLLPFLCFCHYIFSCTKIFLLVFKSLSYTVVP